MKLEITNTRMEEAKMFGTVSGIEYNFIERMGEIISKELDVKIEAMAELLNETVEYDTSELHKKLDEYQTNQKEIKDDEQLKSLKHSYDRNMEHVKKLQKKVIDLKPETFDEHIQHRDWRSSMPIRCFKRVSTRLSNGQNLTIDFEVDVIKSDYKNNIYTKLKASCVEIPKDVYIDTYDINKRRPTTASGINKRIEESFRMYTNVVNNTIEIQTRVDSVTEMEKKFFAELGVEYTIVSGNIYSKTYGITLNNKKYKLYGKIKDNEMYVMSITETFDRNMSIKDIKNMSK